jgi:hypothetical protein
MLRRKPVRTICTKGGLRTFAAPWSNWYTADFSAVRRTAETWRNPHLFARGFWHSQPVEFWSLDSHQ